MEPPFPSAQAADAEHWSRADYYRSLRLLVEAERDAGVAFAPRHEWDLPALDAALPADQSAAPAPKPPTLAQPEFSGGSASERLQRVAELVADCQRCGLCQQRQRSVPGEGNPSAQLMFIGEGPGHEEDMSGRPFVGPAGQLLDRMIQAMGLSRDEVYIANVVKCRPPDNRNPSADEIAACHPYLLEQVDAIAPQVICTLGNVPLRALLGNEQAGITSLRGKAFTWRGRTVLPTFHPSYLLRNESAKRHAWTDLKEVLRILERPLPPPRP